MPPRQYARFIPLSLLHSHLTRGSQLTVCRHEAALQEQTGQAAPCLLSGRGTLRVWICAHVSGHVHCVIGHNAGVLAKAASKFNGSRLSISTGMDAHHAEGLLSNNLQGPGVLTVIV